MAPFDTNSGAHPAFRQKGFSLSFSSAWGSGVPSLACTGHLCRQMALQQVALNLAFAHASTLQRTGVAPVLSSHPVAPRDPEALSGRRTVGVWVAWWLPRVRARSWLRCRAVRPRAWSAAMCSLAAGNGGSLARAAGRGRAGAGPSADSMPRRPRRRAGAGAPGAVGQRRRRRLGGRGC